MVLNDTLSNMMSKLNNGEKSGKSEIVVRPSSKISLEVLRNLKENLYVGDYKEENEGSAKSLRINLVQKINKCGSIKPRFAVSHDSYEKFEKRYLIAKDFGVLIVSTNKGIMTHTEAKEKGLGGRLLAYCY